MARTFTLEQQLTSPAGKEDLRALSDGLAHEDPAIREQCAQRLASLKDPQAGPYLRHALDDDEEQVRVWGAYGLGLLRRKEDQDVLAQAASKDSAPLVRAWATFGLARLGVPGTVAKLVAALDLPDLEVRSNVADALLTLEDASEARPLLEKRMASPDLRQRVWAAAVLLRLGNKQALAAWREGLVDPSARVDAALAASHLQAPEAARELIRVTAELTQDVLEEPVPAASDLPLAEVLTSPLLDLDLETLLEQAREDAGLRMDVLTVILRGPSADPEVLATLYEFASSVETEALGADIASLLSEQEEKDRLELVSRLLDFAPDAVVPTLNALEERERETLFDRLYASAHAGSERTAHLAQLLELLRLTPWEARFADLPEHPWGEPETDVGVDTVDGDEDEDGDEELDEEALAELEALADEEDLAQVVEQLVAGEDVPQEKREAAEAMLAELEMTAEEFVASLQEDEGVPPEPEQVALRAVALGSLQERARIEEALGEKKLTEKAAKEAQQAVLDWLEKEGVLDVVTPLELDLLQAEPGDWLDEDMDLVNDSTEALALLLWAIGQGDLPEVGVEVDPPAVMARVPLRAPTEPFVTRAALRKPELVEPVRDLYETYLWRAEQETTARLALEGEEVEAEIDLETIQEDLVKDGFDLEKARAGGEGAVMAEALRFLGRRAVENLAKEGQLKPVKGDFGFNGIPLLSLSDEDLGAAHALARERHRALNWVMSGGEWDDLSLDEDDVEDEEDLDFDDEDLGDEEDPENED